MSEIQLFSNNATTTLNGAITNVATSITVTDGTVFTAPTGTEYELATIDDGVNIEIVKITARTTNVLTVVRGQEGTSGTAFGDGVDITGRVTATSLSRFVQNDIGGNARGDNTVNIQPSRAVATEVASGTDGIAIGKNTTASGSDSTAIGVDAEATTLNSVALGDSASVTGGNNGIAIGNGSSSSDVNCIAIGNAASASEAQGIAIGDTASVSGIGNAGGVAIGDLANSSLDDSISIGRSSSCSVYNSVAIGLQAACSTGDNGVSIGSLSDAANTEAVAVGHASQALGTYAISIGGDSSTGSGKTQAIAIGRLAYANGADAICLGANTGHGSDYSVALSTGADIDISGRATPYNVSIGKTDYSAAGYTTSLAGPDYLPLEHGTYVGGTTAASHHLMQATERTFYSPPVQAGAKVWAATTAYSHNEVVTPTTPNGYSYYARLSSPYGGTVASSSSEPTWPTTNGGTVAEGSITWVCVDNSNIAFYLPDYLRFIPVEVGFIGDADTAAGGTQPTLSWGIVGSTAKWKAATITTLITGAFSRQMFDVTNTEGSDNMSAAITSLGTGVKSGRVYWKGICVESLTA